MNTTAKNRDAWAEFDWESSRGGDRWSGGFGSPESQWHFSIRPRIHRMLPAKDVCEIAPGFGRWTNYLLTECVTLVGIDLTERCVAACKERFASAPNATFLVNDGLTLPMLGNESVDFVFSMDSLVHCDYETISSYIPEILRVLRADGVAFIHHSNLGAVPVAQADNQHKIHWRAANVSGENVKQRVEDAGGTVYSQELVNWSETPHPIDCYSIFGRAVRSDWTYKRVENVQHIVYKSSGTPSRASESEAARLVGPLYCRE